MKRLVLASILLLAISAHTFAQQTYTVDGVSYTLKTEVEGPLTLLWNSIDGEYRYFVKKGNTVTELKNSRVDGEYQEEYKETLRNLTADHSVSSEKLRFTLADLRDFTNRYNKMADPNFVAENNKIQLSLRFGVFAGASNVIFTQNPTNTILPVFGIDLELLDDINLRRHSVVFRHKQIFKNDEFKYSAAQLSLNYRLKFIASEKIDVFLNTKFVAYTYSKREDFLVEDPANPGTFVETTSSGGDFNAPGTFGIGADYKLGNGYLFLTYNDIIGVGVDSNDEFPLDFSLGYKWSL